MTNNFTSTPERTRVSPDSILHHDVPRNFQVSMMQREREERLESRMVFWGKVEGNENDYLVCYALATPKLEDGDFPIKKVFTQHCYLCAC